MIYCALFIGPTEASLVDVGHLERLMIRFQDDVSTLTQARAVPAKADANVGGVCGNSLE